MFLQADLDSLRRMLGLEEAALPPIIEREYMIRLRMFHADGNSGPLGSVGLIDLVRYLKFGPKPPPEPPKVVDWVRMPTDGSIVVQARVPRKEGEILDTWRSGVYLGRVGMGALAVRLDGDQWVHEFRPSDVRMPMPIAEDAPVVSEPPPEPAKKKTKTETSGYLDHPDLPPPTSVQYDALKLGEPVWVKAEDDFKDGTYQGREPQDPNLLLVLVDGEESPRPFPIEQIFFGEGAIR